MTQQEEKIQTEEIIDPNTKKKEVIEIKYVDPEWTKEELLKVSRKFNIDLSPRVRNYPMHTTEIILNFFSSFTFRGVIS